MNSGGEIMLVQFSIKNVLSFKEETVFDMTAISAYKEHMSNLINIGNKDKFLKVAAIYGAMTANKKIILTQGGPAILTLLSLIISLF